MQYSEADFLSEQQCLLTAAFSGRAGGRETSKIVGGFQ